MTDKKILVWDSSGTMTNSLPERSIIYANAFLMVHPGTDLQITPGNQVVTASEYATKIAQMREQYARFERLNPLNFSSYYHNKNNPETNGKAIDSLIERLEAEASSYLSDI